ncbi:MAG: hypothetical protein KatS3mg110_1516 [Pirellulaceae bacterium]|nr:MAG: hypothetical protein KatS3mg110_1516 [Pirellulaceae bacterium]
MRRWLVLTLLVALPGWVGCQHHNLARRGCGNPYCDRCGAMAQVPPRLPPGYQQQVGPAGPPTAAVAYPYYTLRGPRDFLASQPPSIGN